MPCYYTGSAEGDAALSAQENADRLAKRLTVMTQAFCEAMTALELVSVRGKVSMQKLVGPKTLSIWERHKKVDAKKKAKQMRMI